MSVRQANEIGDPPLSTSTPTHDWYIPAGCRPCAVCLVGAEVNSTNIHLRSHSYNKTKENTNILVQLLNSSSHLSHCRTVTTFLLVIAIISVFQVLVSPPSVFKTTKLLVQAFTLNGFNVMPSICEHNRQIGTNWRLLHASLQTLN